MASLSYINSIYSLKLIFEFTGEKQKYNLIKYNNQFQSKLGFNIFDYKKIFFTKNKQGIKKDNLLDYYDYLKRKFEDKFSLYDIQNYFVEFFCKFIDEKNIIFELNTSHELSVDILLCDSLKTIKLILNLNDYKSSYKTEKIRDKNKKSFINLFQAIFDEKRITKISQITIISDDDKDLDNFNYFFIKTLAINIYKFRPIIKTSLIPLYSEIYSYSRKLKNYNGDDTDIFKLWKLIIPFEKKYLFTCPKKILDDFEFEIDLTRPITIKDSDIIDFIKENKIKNYFAKLNYEDLWLFNDDLANIKKLELTMNGNIIEDITNFDTVDRILWGEDRGRGRGRGRNCNRKNNQVRIEEMENNFNYNKEKYIKYFNMFYNYLNEAREEEESRLRLLTFLEKSEFDILIILTNYINGHDISHFSLNKLMNSIEFCLCYYNSNEIGLLKELKKYESVKLEIEDANSDENKKTYNLFKFNEESKIKYFYLTIYFYRCSPSYYLDFPLNYEKLITLDLTYTLIVNNDIHINFPLTEKECKYKFPNLKNLKLDFIYDCQECESNSPKELIQNLCYNFKYCPSLENLDITYQIFEKKIDELNILLNGIKCLKYLKSLYIKSKEEERSIIAKNEFYKSYPEYISYCPFLNDIKIELSEFLKYDLLYEKNINYKINDFVIDGYSYIGTLGEKSSYSTYLCKNKENKKVVIRKFKKSRINNSLDLFENEKYCLKKYKNNPNFINYIDFLSDELFEYIVYEYIENCIKKYRSKMVKNKICDILEKFYISSKEDKNIILLPILPNNILIKNDFDVILIGFGYLNLYPNDEEKDGKLNKFYYNMQTYFKENFTLNPLSDSYNDYINDIKNYYDSNFSWSYGLAKLRYEYFYNIRSKIKNELKFEKKLNIGKIILNKKYIFTLQNDSIIIYDKKKFVNIADINFSYEEKEEEEEDDKEEKKEKGREHNNLLNFILIDDNIIIALDEFKIYIFSFINNKLKKKNSIEYKNLNINQEIDEIAYIENKNILFLIGNKVNIVSSWQLNKTEKKLKFIKFYKILNSDAIFKIKNDNDTPLISVGNEKLIFYSINKEFDLISSFDYSHNIKNWPIYKLKQFKQDEEFCYVLLLNTIMIIKVNYEQKKIDCLFHCCLGREEINYIFLVQKGLLFGIERDFFKYLTKINDQFEIIKNSMYFDEKIYDIIKEQNHLIIMGENKIIELKDA